MLPTLEITKKPNSHINTAAYGVNGSVRPGIPIIRKAYPGLDAVLDEMKRLVTEFKGRPKIRAKAVSITSGISKDPRTNLPNRRNYQAIAESVYNWMKSNIAYVRDPDGIEWLQTPLKTIENGFGDCDDQATLAGALLSSIGVPTRFKVVKADASKPEAFTHIFLEYKTGGRWMPFDPTLHSKAGDGLADNMIHGSRTVMLDDAGSDCGCDGECPGNTEFTRTILKWTALGSMVIVGAVLVKQKRKN